jgi:superfamily II DNA helicase RecQ
MPSSIDAYYRECGIARRDGASASICVLFYQYSGYYFLETFYWCDYIDLLWLLFLINHSNCLLLNFVGKKFQESKEIEIKALMEILCVCEYVIECHNFFISQYLGEQPKMCKEDGFVCWDNRIDYVLYRKF